MKRVTGFKPYKRTSNSRIAHFDSGFVDTANFSKDDPIVKKALVLVEGTHIDSNKRTHTFSPSRIRQIVDNSNAFLRRTRIPLLKDHKKQQDATIGDVTGDFVARVITEEDLPDNKYSDLVGKLGIFASEVIVKAEDAIRKVQQGIINTISPGIDVVTDTIKEISATPIPAIAGMSLFAREARFTALTLSDALSVEEDMDSFKQEAHDLLDKLMDVMENIAEADEEDLQGETPVALQKNAIDEFASLLGEMLGVSGEEVSPLSEEEQMQLEQLQMRQQLVNGGMKGGSDPNFLKRQQALTETNMNRNQSRMALFTMGDIETELYGEDFANFAEKKQGGLGRTVRNVALGAAGVAALGGAARYGGRAVKTGMKVARKARNVGMGRRGAASLGFVAGAKSAGRRVRRDLQRARRGLYSLLGNKPNPVR